MLLLFLAACAPEIEQASLSNEQLAKIMSEIAIADASVSIITGFRKDSMANAYYSQIFAMQGTTPEEYENSLRIIVRQEGRLDSVVSMAEALLKQQQSDVSSSAAPQ